MRDPEIQQLLGRAGGAVQPDAEFEEELLLRLEAAAVTCGDTAPVAAQQRLMVVGEVRDDPTLGRETSGRRTGRMLAVAAAVLLFIGIGSIALVVSRDREQTPAATPVSGVTLPAVPRLGVEAEAAFAEVCRRWSGVLAEIDAAGSPLFPGGRPDPDEELTAMADQLRVAVDEYAAAAAVASELEPVIGSTLHDLESMIESELVFIARGRDNGARYSFPTIVDGLIRVSGDLADLGVEPCR